MTIPRFVVLDKKVGETPLSCAETWRAAQPPAYRDLPLAYAGRLDPLASGKLLVLIGDECKRQTDYHALDKRYEFSVLLGVTSDTGDVMGRLTHGSNPPTILTSDITATMQSLRGRVSFPYPAFSSKTVAGKPLHTWSMEGRLHEITIPTYTATIHQLHLIQTEMTTRTAIAAEALAKINSIPPVTELRKALGNDFRRTDIRADWQRFLDTGSPDDKFTIITCSCTGSSGLYMRTLASEIGRQLGDVPALAYSIHRTHIGHYQPLPLGQGFWWKQYR